MKQKLSWTQNVCYWTVGSEKTTGNIWEELQTYTDQAESQTRDITAFTIM